MNKFAKEKFKDRMWRWKSYYTFTRPRPKKKKDLLKEGSKDIKSGRSMNQNQRRLLEKIGY